MKERWEKLKHEDCQHGHIMCQFLSIGFNLWLISKVLHKILIHLSVPIFFFFFFGLEVPFRFIEYCPIVNYELLE